MSILHARIATVLKSFISFVVKGIKPFSLTLIILFTSFGHTQSGSPIPSSYIDISELTLIPLTYQELDCPELSYDAFSKAAAGFFQMKEQAKLKNDSLLTIIDFAKSSAQNRFFVINLNRKEVVLKELVAHGKNTGMEYAEKFSNNIHSLQSSLGFYLTDKTYMGKHGYSLRIDGLEKGINDNAWDRAIVIHGADYVSQQYVERHGRLGRSFGCPALSYDLSKQTIDLIKEGSLLFIHHPSRQGNNLLQ